MDWTLPLMTFVLGQAVVLGVEIFRSRSERARALEEREQDRAEARAGFQRETLLALQEVIHELTDAVVNTVAPPLEELRGEAPAFPERARIIQLVQAVSTYAVRVDDETLRGQVEELGNLAFEVTAPRDPKKMTSEWRPLFRTVNVRIGELLRKGY